MLIQKNQQMGGSDVGPFLYLLYSGISEGYVLTFLTNVKEPPQASSEITRGSIDLHRASLYQLI